MKTKRSEQTSGSENPSTIGSLKRAKQDDDILPVEQSVGFQIRMTHRALQKYLQTMIEPHGVSLGMYYYLRALWNEDGLTQRELSQRIGTMEPSTLSAIVLMERKGFVRRVRNKDDKRKLHVFLTAKGKELSSKLLPLARQTVEEATVTLTKTEVKAFLHAAMQIRQNIAAKLGEFDGDVD